MWELLCLAQDGLLIYAKPIRKFAPFVDMDFVPHDFNISFKPRSIVSSVIVDSLNCSACGEVANLDRDRKASGQ